MDFGRSDPNITAWAATNDLTAPGNFTTQQYLLGPRLLIAPITLPNVTSWDVYLPKVDNSTSGGSSAQPWTFW